MKLNSRYIHSLILAAGVLSAAAQNPASNPSAAIPSGPYPEASATLGNRFSEARRLSDQSNFRGVIDQLRAMVISSESPLSPDESRQFLYLLGNAYYHTSAPRALNLLDDYIARWPAGADALEVKFLQADFYFFAHDWSAALERYKFLNVGVLNTAQRDLYTYREALCMIKCGFYSEALPLLDKLEKSKEYSVPATYYKAYINYVNGEDSTAMQLFRSVADEIDPSSELCPDYYIAQLLYRGGKWKETSSMAASLLKKNLNRELALPTRCIHGMSEYEMGNYEKAAPILRRYVKEAGESASHDALYALGVCEYAAGNHSAAEEALSRVAEDHDVIGQGAALYLGQIAAQRGEVSVAAMNFERGYRMNYDNKVAEAALFNYVVARAHGGNIPFDTNVVMLEDFIRNYPNSQFAPTIERHLATLYYNEGDYNNALRVAERLMNPSKSDLVLLQAILYSGGTSALASANPQRAATLLQKCVGINGADRNVQTQARIWLGDALYDLHRYKEAEQQYAAALNTSNAGDNALHARYNLGYSQMMQNNFKGASATFNKLLSSSVNIPDDINHDTRMRLADCKYYAGDYAAAKKDFENLRSGGNGADYASYRHAQLLGIEGDLNGKISELTKIEREFSDSPWLVNALNELADSYVAVGKPKEAAAAYSRILKKFPVDASAPRAQLGMASALMESGQPAKATDSYKEILRRWPSSSEAKLADEALRDYYAENGGLTNYAEFLKSIPGFSLNAAQMDKLAYEAAERQYLSYTYSAHPLEDYLQEYPDGEHAAEAYSLLARHFYDAGDKSKALAAYRELEKRGGTEYAVEAAIGIMRTADNSGVRADYAKKVLNSGGAPSDAVEEAEFYMTEALLSSKKGAERGEAEKKLRQLSNNPYSEFGARSAVALGEYLLKQNRIDEVLPLMEEFTSSGSEKLYWVARGFIVMADAYTARGDKYMAKEYLQSLRRNYPGKEADIKQAIEQRLK